MAAVREPARLAVEAMLPEFIRGMRSIGHLDAGGEAPGSVVSLLRRCVELGQKAIAHHGWDWIAQLGDRLVNRATAEVAEVTRLTLVGRYVTQPQVDRWRDASAALVVRLPVQQVKVMQTALVRAHEEGLTMDGITDALRATLDTTDAHCRLLARDQTMKLFADVRQANHRAVGLDSYLWSSSHDERVRESHRELDGQHFRYDVATPIGLHPGQDYQCRCNDIPLIPDGF
jgi:SPP1 gp7 family putative phage head morphogenesis protein